MICDTCKGIQIYYIIWIFTLYKFSLVFKYFLIKHKKKLFLISKSFFGVHSEKVHIYSFSVFCVKRCNFCWNEGVFRRVPINENSIYLKEKHLASTSTHLIDFRDFGYYFRFSSQLFKEFYWNSIDQISLMKLENRINHFLHSPSVTPTCF